MLTVGDYELTRRKHLANGMSQRAIARELGHVRNTVAKAFGNPIPPGDRLSARRGKPVIDSDKPSMGPRVVLVTRAHLPR